MNALQEKYKTEIKKALQKQLDIKNVMAAPDLQKIVVNVGIGKEYSSNTGVVDDMKSILSQITGQVPIVLNSKVAISNFKLREGMPNGLKVTLRKERMWDFYAKLVNITLPR